MNEPVMPGVVLVNNPGWSKAQLARARRGELQPMCHDRTDYITMMCQLGHANHLHRSQIEPLPDDAEIGGRCHYCGDVMLLRREYLLHAMDIAWGRNRG